MTGDAPPLRATRQDAQGVQAVSGVPAGIDHAGTMWEITRSWPNGDHDIFEARGPRSSGVIAGTWSPTAGARVVPAESDHRLPGLARPTGGTLISHRLGKRAVLRSADGTEYTKVVRPGRARSILTGISRFSPVGDALRTPRVLAAFGDSVVLATLPGRTLHDLAPATAARRQVWARHWRYWSDQWSGAVLEAASRTAAPMDVPVHTGADEARIVTEWIDRAGRFLPADQLSELRRIGAAIGDRLTEPGRPVIHRIGHRDLHDKQILLDEIGAVGVLDVDTAARIEPELDPANLAAHTVLRHAQGHYTHDQAAIARAEVLRCAERIGCDPERLRLYEQAALLRLGCLYLFRPRWHTTARSLLAGFTINLR